MSRPTIASLTADLEAANAKIGDLEAAAATELVSAPLDETVAALQAEIESYVEAIGELEAKALNAADIKDGLETKVSELESKASELESAVDAAKENWSEAARALEAEKLKAEEAAAVTPTDLEAEVAKLKRELADALNKLSGKAHGPCCEKTVRMIVRGENMSGAKHHRYLKQIELLNKVK